MIFIAALVLAIWAVQIFDFVAGTLRIPKLSKNSAEVSGQPRVSIIFAARNEEQRVGGALTAMLAQDYPDFEVIAVDDRSTDGTRDILQGFAGDYRLKVVEIQSLPAGWLGKTHALYQGYRRATGEWILFTDADVTFSPEMLRSAVPAARGAGWDHLVLLADMEARGLVEKIFTHYFVFGFLRRFRPWAVSNPRSKAYVGFGAFNLVRRGAYEKIGTHQALALSVVDDMDLGRKIKQAGFRQGVMLAREFVHVRWFEGWRGVFRSIEKNGFAALDFNPWTLVWMTALAFVMDILPFLLILLARGPVFQLSLASVVLIGLGYAAAGRYDPSFFLSFPAHPAGSLLFFTSFWRSSLDVMRKGGITWRETFYSTKDLKAHR